MDSEGRPDLVKYLMSDGVEIVDITNDAVIVVEPPKHFYGPVEKANSIKLAATDDLMTGPEFGSTTTWGSYLREEYNPELRGSRGLQKYDRMRKGDAAVRSSLRTLTTPITGATWFIQPSSTSNFDKEIARFVWRNLTQLMTYSWDNVLKEALLMLPLGFYTFEKVWSIREVDGERRIVLKKLAPRHPLDIVEGGWTFDANGGPRAIEFYAGGRNTQNTVVIPIEKLAIFTFEGEAGDLRGTSILRSAYKHWFFKENAYKIDAIQKERHGIGIPIIKLPAGFTPKDKTTAQELGRNLRTNEKAHVVLPPMWEIMFAKIEGQPVSALETANHHALMIYQNVLAQAMWGEGASSGETSETMMELFYKSTREIANTVRDVMNKYVIPQLVMSNWNVDTFPELKVRKLGDTQEARTLSFALRNLVGAGVIQVDDDLERWAREIMDAPEHDPSTLRVVSQPQLPGGAPRQSQASNMQIKPGAGAGRDGSGAS